MPTKKTTAENALFDDFADQAVAERTRPKCNDLDGKTWLRYSISIWDDIRKSTEESRLKHPAMFPVMLVRRVIQMFLRAGDGVVLDPFVGSGSTVLAALEEGKTGIGIDISAEYIRQAERRCQDRKTLWDSPDPTGNADLRVGSATKLRCYVAANSVDLCVTSPPYWNILNQRRTADNKAIRHYGNFESDLGVIADYEEFLDGLGLVFRQVFLSLRPRSYCAVVVMDLRKKDCFFSFHSDLATRMHQIGFIYDDLIIWNRASEYNNLRPLGYPSVFRVNKVHEFILLFLTPGPDEKHRIDSEILAGFEQHDATHRVPPESG